MPIALPICALIVGASWVVVKALDSLDWEGSEIRAKELDLEIAKERTKQLETELALKKFDAA